VPWQIFVTGIPVRTIKCNNQLYIIQYSVYLQHTTFKSAQCCYRQPAGTLAWIHHIMQKVVFPNSFHFSQQSTSALYLDMAHYVSVHFSKKINLSLSH